MDFVKKFTSNEQGEGEQHERRDGEGQQNEQKSEGGFLGGLSNKLNSAAGGGKESEKNEDLLDKGSYSIHYPLLRPGFVGHLKHGVLTFMKAWTLFKRDF